MSGHRRRTEPAPDADEAGALSASPFPGDLAEEPATVPRSRRWQGLTTYLGAGALLAAGFAIGIQAERHLGRQSTASPPGSPSIPAPARPSK